MDFVRVSADSPEPRPPRLVLVGVPIGHPDDLGLRARALLARADLLLCEDRKTAARLYHHHGLAFPKESYRLLNEHTTPGELGEVLALVRASPLTVLISDAGMPVLADPGAELVRAARRAGIAVEVVPGPTAATAALARAGLGNRGYFFAGFCPRKSDFRRKFLNKLVTSEVPVVLYEAPYRSRPLLEDIHRVFPGTHRIYLAIGLTTDDDFELDCFCAEIPRHVDRIPQGPPVFILYRPE